MINIFFDAKSPKEHIIRAYDLIDNQQYEKALKETDMSIEKANGDFSILAKAYLPRIAAEFYLNEYNEVIKDAKKAQENANKSGLFELIVDINEVLSKAFYRRADIVTSELTDKSAQKVEQWSEVINDCRDCLKINLVPEMEEKVNGILSKALYNQSRLIKKMLDDYATNNEILSEIGKISEESKSTDKIKKPYELISDENDRIPSNEAMYKIIENMEEAVLLKDGDLESEVTKKRLLAETYQNLGINYNNIFIDDNKLFNTNDDECKKIIKAVAYCFKKSNKIDKNVATYEMSLLLSYLGDESFKIAKELKKHTKVFIGSKLRDTRFEAIKHYSFAINYYEKASKDYGKFVGGENHVTNTHLKNARFHRAQIVAALGIENSGQVKDIIDMAEKEVSNLDKDVAGKINNEIKQSPAGYKVATSINKAEFYDLIVKDLEQTDMDKNQLSEYYNLRGKARARNAKTKEQYDEAFEDFGKSINKEPDKIGVYFNRFWYGIKCKWLNKSSLTMKEIINDFKSGCKNLILSIPRFVEYNLLQSKMLNSKTFVFGVGALLTITGIASFAIGPGVTVGLPLLGLGIPIIANYVNNSLNKHPSTARKDKKYLGFDHVLFDRDYIGELLFKTQSCEKTLNFDNDFKNRLDAVTLRYDTLCKKSVELETQINTTNLDNKDLKSLIDTVASLKEGMSESKLKAENLYKEVYHKEISQPTFLINKIRNLKEDVLKLSSEINQEKDNKRIPTEIFENLNLVKQELSKINLVEVYRDLLNRIDSFPVYKARIDDWEDKVDKIRKDVTLAKKTCDNKSWISKVFHGKKSNTKQRNKNNPIIGDMS